MKIVEKVKINVSDTKTRTLFFRNKPIFRCEDVIFYGDIAADFVIKMEIKSKRTINNSDNTKTFEIVDNILVFLLKSALISHGNFRPIKISEKHGLYEALDLASVWLERALKTK